MMHIGQKFWQKVQFREAFRLQEVGTYLLKKMLKYWRWRLETKLNFSPIIYIALSVAYCATILEEVSKEGKILEGKKRDPHFPMHK